VILRAVNRVLSGIRKGEGAVIGYSLLSITVASSFGKSGFDSSGLIDQDYQRLFWREAPPPLRPR